MEKEVTPLHDRVIVKPTPNSPQTSGGVYIPDIAKEKPKQGIVLSVGDGVNGIPLKVKNGDNVLYEKNAGSEIEVNGETCLIMREANILAII